ncbi:hypothetical protein ACIQ57_07285 [Lysinibacillus xylanilyticus]|uniref:hypothetical protein n=1 Tax=Lysinibacillus xylanilyticus TaxID=582475 RepID=UPI0037F340DC
MHEEEIKLVEYIKKEVPQINSRGKVYFKGDIPKKKIKVAFSSIAPGVFENMIRVYVDTTILGKGDDGFIVTTSSLYFKEIGANPIHIPFENIERVELTNKKLTVTCLGKNVNLSSTTFKLPETQIFLNEMKSRHEKLKDLSVKCATDRILALEEMDVKVQINYLKTLVAYEKKVMGNLLSAPFSEILGLMTQLNFKPEMRQEIKRFIVSDNADFEESLQMTVITAPYGNIDNVQYSLLKDIIRLTRSRDKSKASNNINLIYAGDLLNLSGNLKDKIDFIESAIINDEKLIDGQISEKEFEKNIKTLIAGGAAVGVPVAAIYISGSVVGLSAAGITSGLAAFGFGGLLGFSSMLTGIGVLIVGGVGVYTGVKYLTGGKQRKVSSKREKMIQEIIKIHQATINALIDDINYFTEELNRLSQDYEENALKIAKLMAEMQLYNEALTKIKSKSSCLELVVK